MTYQILHLTTNKSVGRRHSVVEETITTTLQIGRQHNKPLFRNLFQSFCSIYTTFNKYRLNWYCEDVRHFFFFFVTLVCLNKISFWIFWRVYKSAGRLLSILCCLQMDVKSHSGFREASIRGKKNRAKPLISWQSRPSFATQLHYVSFSLGSLFINKKHTSTIKNDIGKNRYLVVFDTFTAKYLKQF